MRLFIYSSVFIALAAASLTLGTFYWLGSTGSPVALTAFVFFATLALYNLDRLVGGQREDRITASDRHIWIANHRRQLWGLTALGSVGVVATLPFLNKPTLWALAPLAVLSLGYAVPLLGSRRFSRLKEVTAMKTVFIAVVWAAVTVILPAVEGGHSLTDGQILRIAFERFIYVYALTLPFDVRDRHRDQKSGIKTVAVLLGARPALVLSLGLLLAFTISTASAFVLFGTMTDLAMAATGVATTFAIIPALLRGDSDQPPSDLYYGGLLDGFLLLQGLLLLVIN